MEKILNKCPICGADLEYSALYQYEKVFKITKRGTLSVNPKREEDVGTMECGVVTCSDSDCDFRTDCDLEVEGYDEFKIHQVGEKYILEIEGK